MTQERKQEMTETNQEAQERLVSQALESPSVKEALDAYAAIQETAVVLTTQVAKVHSSTGANT